MPTAQSQSVTIVEEAREQPVTEALFHEIGATATITKQISEADVALFALVTTDSVVSGDGEERQPPPLVRQPRQAVPFAMLAALLASAAARHLSHLAHAHFERQVIEFAAPAYTDDTISATAEIAGYDHASHSLHVRARCDNQEGLRLAEGEFILRDE